MITSNKNEVTSWLQSKWRSHPNKLETDPEPRVMRSSLVCLFLVEESVNTINVMKPRTESRAATETLKLGLGANASRDQERNLSN